MYTCKYCPGGQVTKKCQFCQHCLLHPNSEGRTCICVQCRQCAKRFPQRMVCMKCRRCNDHHHKGSYIGKEFPMRGCQYAAPPATTFLLNPLKRTLGVEAEISNIGTWDSPPTKILTYNQEHDGSVRPSAAEFVLSPARGDRFQKGLTEFLRHLHAADATVNNTCGYHVHVDGADLKYTDLRRLLAMFGALQGQIFGTLIAGSRATNEYCTPIKYSRATLASLFKLTNSEMKEWFHQELYGLSVAAASDLNTRKYINEQLKAKKAHKYENVARRWALNFHSWMMRGTIEFRCKEGTLDQGDFLLWPLFCGWFVETGANLSDSTVLKWLTSAPPSLTEFTAKHMPPVVQSWVNHRLKEPALEPVVYGGEAPRRALDGIPNATAYAATVNQIRQAANQIAQPVRRRT